MSYSLNFLKGSYIGDYIGATKGVIKGDVRSLGYRSNRDMYYENHPFRGIVCSKPLQIKSAERPNMS